VEPWLQAGKYAAALMSQMPRRNGWTVAEHAGDRAPDKTQRLLNRAVWDAAAAAGVVRRFAVAGLDQAGGRRGLVVGAVDEAGQVKQDGHTAGVKRHYLGCAGKVANRITTRNGHAYGSGGRRCRLANLCAGLARRRCCRADSEDRSAYVSDHAHRGCCRALLFC
jgi:SRSO17 transposase